MASMIAARMISASCQPKAEMKVWPRGAKTNCPIDPAAIPMPKAKERLSAGRSLPKAAMTREKAEPAMPSPISTPAAEMQHQRRFGGRRQRQSRRIKERAERR